MNTDALSLFCDLARLKSFSETARRRGISQSAVSQVIQSLERSLGVPLFDRTKRPFRMTRKGQLFFDECHKLVERYEALVEEIKSKPNSVTGVVRIAAIYSVGLTRMGGLLQEFNRRHPRAKARVSYLHPDKIYEGLLLEEYDLGILSCPERTKGLRITPWLDQEMVLVCHPSHRFARDEKIPGRAFLGEPFVGFEKGLSIRRRVDLYLRAIGAKPNVLMAFDNIETIKQAVEDNVGISILPRETLHGELVEGSLCAVPLRSPGLVRQMAILSRESDVSLSPVQAFIDVIQDLKGEEPSV